MVNKLRLPVIATLVFWAIWWLIAQLYNSVLFPGPVETFKSFITIVTTSSNWDHIGITTYRVFIGTLIGSTGGTLLGIATRYNKLIKATVGTVIYPLLQAVPTISWALIFVLWFGLSNITPVMTIAVAVAPFFIINIWEGMKELDNNLVEMASTYTASKKRILSKIIFPMLYPFVFAATKSSFMIAWKIVVLAEIFGATSGMGYMLSIAFDSYRIVQVFGWTLGFAVILIAFDHGIFNFIDRKFIRKWKPQEIKS